MTRECHVRFWESAEVRFLCATHLPLYRLEKILKRYGGQITRTTLANWIIRLVCHGTTVAESSGMAFDAG